MTARRASYLERVTSRLAPTAAELLPPRRLDFGRPPPPPVQVEPSAARPEAPLTHAASSELGERPPEAAESRSAAEPDVAGGDGNPMPVRASAAPAQMAPAHPVQSALGPGDRMTRGAVRSASEPAAAPLAIKPATRFGARRRPAPLASPERTPVADAAPEPVRRALPASSAVVAADDLEVRALVSQKAAPRPERPADFQRAAAGAIAIPPGQAAGRRPPAADRAAAAIVARDQFKSATATDEPASAAIARRGRAEESAGDRELRIGSIEVVVSPPPAPIVAPRPPAAPRPAASPGRLSRGFTSSFGLRQG